MRVRNENLLKAYKFQISTSSMVTGVRGTDFHVEHNSSEGHSTVTTLEGVVSLRDKGSAVGKLNYLRAGERLEHFRQRGFVAGIDKRWAALDGGFAFVKVDGHYLEEIL